jgi:hypothetical protein
MDFIRQIEAWRERWRKDQKKRRETREARNQRQRRLSAERWDILLEEEKRRARMEEAQLMEMGQAAQWKEGELLERRRLGIAVRLIRIGNV